MNTSSLTKSKDLLLLMLSLLALVLVTMFNSCKKSAEKTSETIIEKSIGGDANVDIDDEKFVIETEEGTFTSDASVRTWPSEIPNEVPEFKYGKVVNVSTQSVDESKNWTVMFEDVPNNALDTYEAALKKDGFKVSTISIGDTKGHITAEKDKLFVLVMGGEGMASLSVGVEK